MSRGTTLWMATSCVKTGGSGEYTPQTKTDDRFAVANVAEGKIVQLGDRLRQLNEIMGMA